MGIASARTGIPAIRERTISDTVPNQTYATVDATAAPTTPKVGIRMRSSTIVTQAADPSRRR